MQFNELYNLTSSFVEDRVAGGNLPIVPVSWMLPLIQSGVPWICCINFYDIVEMEGDEYPLGMMKCFGDQDVAYEAENAWMVAVYENSDRIDGNMCWKRFVRCKEMMHVFDENAEYVQSQENYVDLLGDIVDRPPGPPSPQMISESHAQWKALLVLCPIEERNKIVQCQDDDYDTALKYRIPLHYIPAIKSEGYLLAHSMYCI